MNINQIVRNAKKRDLIVKPVIDNWLLKHGDDPLPEWVAERIKELLKEKPRVRSGSFSGSSAGSCLRLQELQFAGLEGEAIDPQLRNIFNDGKWRHLRYQAMGLMLGLFTDVEYLVQWKKHKSRGSLDARGEVADDHPVKAWRGLEYGFELKGVSTFQFQNLKNNGPLEKHKRQRAHYFVLGNFDLFSTLYEDKTTQETFEWVDLPDPALIAEAEHDIHELSRSVRTKTLHPMLPECVQKRGAWRECPFGKNGKCLRATSVIPSPFVHST